MCSRYYIDQKLYDDIESIVGIIPKERRFEGDVHPSERTLVIIGNKKPEAKYDMAWGYPGRNGKGLLINARAETVEEKPTFRNAIVSRRCLIPARSFYEWDKEKNKVTFYTEDRNPLFFAGCYDVFKEGLRFTVITTAANDSV